jgi:hypothetical protein
MRDIQLDGSAKALMPCVRCGNDWAWIYPQVGGQRGSKLVCKHCNSFHNWLSPKHPKAHGNADADDGEVLE